MKKPDTTIIDQDWPAEELEEVHNCPYCGSEERTIAYENVQDWSFYCAPGKWTYWNCINCKSLYLNPRPKKEFIYKAYANYYTHSNENTSFIKKAKEKLRNECYSYWLNTSIEPRLNLPKWTAFVLKIFKKRIQIPFALEQLVALPKGRLLDVGCGSGKTLLLARQLGWEVTGLEIDPKAVEHAKKQGLNVILGDYDKLEGIDQLYECVICSHVLEHVYDPKKLMFLLKEKVSKAGMLILSLPNSRSYVLKFFGVNWRGLEAPRHISIPAKKMLVEILKEQYECIFSFNTIDNETYAESKNISTFNKITQEKNYANIVGSAYLKNISENIDIIKIYCKK